ncbi:Subtilase family protein [compost metagenome]
MASISSIQFKSQDSAKYAKAYLQNHPSVSTVYFTPKIQGGSEIWRWDNSNLSGPLPSTTTPDPELLKNEQDNWYWVNRHKVLQSWSEINFSNLPEVVVIDSGFDIDATISDDRPNYSLSDARYIDQDGNASPKGAHFADPSLIREPSGNTYSHGTMVSSIISAPKGNSVGLFGIVPGMPVIPFKIYSINGKNFDNGSGITECSIVSAILLSNTQTNSRVTSISISPVGGPLTVLPGIRAVVDTVSRNGQIVVFCSGNQLMDTGSLASYVDSGQIVVGGTQANGRNWREWSSKKNTWIGANYGSWVDLAASANDIYVFDYNPSTNTRISRLVGGTSFSTPMVAATAAITRQLFLTNGGTYGYELELVRIIRDILIYSSSFGQSSDGTKQGRGLVRSSSSEEVPDIRELNVANSYRIAKSATRNPMIRMTNVDDETRAYYNASTYYLKTTAPKGSDVMLDSTDDAVNIIDIGTHNTSGVRSHGYQLWRYGKIVTEEVKGVAERHAPWGKLYDTRGEDAGSTSTGWNYWVYWRKIP